MRKLSTLLTVGLMLMSFPQLATAQISNIALGQAKSRLACGAGVVVSSVFLPNGSLQVTCARNPAKSSSTASTSTVVQTTGLVAPTGIGILGTVTIVVAITGGGGGGTTTTTEAQFFGESR